MELGQILSWLVGAIGLTGFYFAGKRVWWSWYINILCQILWVAYALVTGQPAFLATAAVYSVIFGWNAYKWTKDHLVVRNILKEIKKSDGDTHILPGGVKVTASIMDEHGFTEADIHLIARTCHETNRILQRANGEEPSLPWHLAPEWQTDSALRGVRAALRGETSEELHDSWVRHKLNEGWIWGPAKSEVMKTHPCIAPYSELSDEQKIKDEMFRAVVKSFKLEKQNAHVPQS
ncbi:membrane protein [Arthrobacter phage Truckee]|nr:membrane protein [Arthrobacter phage Truckee]